MPAAERQRQYRQRQKVKLERALAGKQVEPPPLDRDAVLAELWTFACDKAMPGTGRLTALKALLEALPPEPPPGPFTEFLRRRDT